ncbi:hypothetical protein TruAng_011682 [Truncatella angustata]|nr:hypothetical protein TruAng_011682 [Truncatella angustata]
MERPRRGLARYQADHDDILTQNIPNITSISRTNSDGEFCFTYSHPKLTSASVLEVCVIPQERSGYPSEHFFLVFATSEVPPAVAKMLENFGPASSGQKLRDALLTLSAEITSSIECNSTENAHDEDAPDTPMTDVEDEELECDEDDGDFEDFEYDNYDDDIDGIFGLSNDGTTDTQRVSGETITADTVERTWRDFRAVRQAGFKISKIYGFDKPVLYHVVSVSVRVNKLCLSEETRDAWNLKANDYIVLLIRYTGQYLTFDQALDRAAASTNIDFRLRKCVKYKPTIEQATKVFSASSTNPKFSATPPSLLNDQTGDDDDDDAGLALLGIGESIDNLMKNDFIRMLKLRCTKEATTWDAAKRRLMAWDKMLPSQRQTSVDIDSIGSCVDDDKSDDIAKLPGFIAKEHLLSDGEISLPLIAAQLAMRYYIRCTDYCMVCHQQVDANFEALKPYVCANSLCLFQYMSMGFGPSIDLEVLNQPNVVDLLVSFCYAGLQRVGYGGAVTGLREYPIGLDLKVPKIFPQNFVNSAGSVSSTPSTEGIQEVIIKGAKLVDPLHGSFDRAKSSFILDSRPSLFKVKEGSWVVVVLPAPKDNHTAQDILYHCRVECIIGIVLSLHIASAHTLPVTSTTDAPFSLPGTESSLEAYLLPYDHSLDNVDDATKALAMTILLAATPSIGSMREYLKASPNRQLDSWNRLVPSASKLLRWVVASNRSYIVQVDELASTDSAVADVSLARHHERISGVDGWVQFRFAQGSPEKEIQFQEELKMVQKPQKTILAWHGSHISNWHSIIRVGLDFKIIANGRSFGDGVYFARDFNTSLGYIGNRYPTSQGGSTSPSWPNSALKINSAMSLSEIVNRPEEFVNHARTEWCYVVDKVHWIQCRYLFVRPGNPSLLASHAPPTCEQAEFVQPSGYVATGPGSKKISVPKAAIPSANESNSKKTSVALRKHAKGHVGDSDGEEAEDFAFAWNKQQYILQTGETDFRPGLLDLSTLPRLLPPSYATSHGQKTIAREIKKLQNVQSATPMHELGWYIDFNNITNMFQWIVELHSFDPKLPLAQDMKKAGVSSIVLEVRFGRDFPLSPPFLRVIRPRFLPFGSGGGGHVTLGGAMCMELLTNTGWSPASSLESVLLQVRMALTSVDPHPAQLESKHSPTRDYGILEAYEAFIRATQAHGWQVPEDLQEAITAMTAGAPEGQ